MCAFRQVHGAFHRWRRFTQAVNELRRARNASLKQRAMSEWSETVRRRTALLRCVRACRSWQHWRLSQALRRWREFVFHSEIQFWVARDSLKVWVAALYALCLLCAVYALCVLCVLLSLIHI